MEYLIDKNKVTVNGKTTEFPFEIGESFVIKDILVVYLDIPFDGKHDKNDINAGVYGINNKGEIIWRIQKVSDAYPGGEDMPYTGITKRANDIMTVSDFWDRVFIVDPCTGEILGRHKGSR